MKFEIEIKLRLPADLQPIRKTLRNAGFRVEKRRVFESNVLFDDAKLSLRKQGKLIRVRRVGSRCIFTYKGPGQPGRHKKRHEVETDVSDPGALQEILMCISFRPGFRYDKYRTEYSKASGTGKIMLDETPIGNYLELEGNARWIDQTARLLGFSKTDYNLSSYGYLYQTYCRERGIAPTNMVFSKHRNT